ncbi:hypothetical protein D3C84_1273980 [compost metagenome]
MVRTEQGAMTMPSVRNEPDDTAAPTSPTLWTTSARSLRSAIESSVSCDRVSTAALDTIR